MGFSITSENLWQSVGAELIEETNAAGKIKRVWQILVACATAEISKHHFLSEQNLSIGSEWLGAIV
jgi:hypothetical protein